MSSIAGRQKAYAALVAQVMKAYIAVVGAERATLDDLNKTEDHECKLRCKPRWFEFGGVLTCPRICDYERICINQPPIAIHRYAKDQKELCCIAHFLNCQAWSPCSEETPAGITWLELMLMYELGGYSHRQSAQGKAAEFAKAIKAGYY